MPWLEISSHDIDCVEYVCRGLTWGSIFSTCVISLWGNNIKCKYMFMFPLKNLARKESTARWSNPSMCSLYICYNGLLFPVTICIYNLLLPNLSFWTPILIRISNYTIQSANSCIRKCSSDYKNIAVRFTFAMWSMYLFITRGHNVKERWKIVLSTCWDKTKYERNTIDYR